MAGNFGARDFMMGHGAFGSIIKISSSTIAMQSPDNTEKIVLVSPDTAIKRFRDVIQLGDLKEKDEIVVFGSPNDSGEIEAKLIRVAPPPSSGFAP